LPTVATFAVPHAFGAVAGVAIEFPGDPAGVVVAASAFGYGVVVPTDGVCVCVAALGACAFVGCAVDP
jgi:hypothetical protein